MRHLRTCLAVAMIALLAAGTVTLAQQSEQEEKQETPRIKITGKPPGGKVKLTERERSEPAPEAAPKVARPEPSAEITAMMAASMPGPEFEFLKQLLGQWEVKMRYTPAPGAEPMTGRGQASRELVLGGRFIQTTYKGEFMGESSLGIGYDGYDNTKKKYVGIWMDNMSTAINYFEGELDDTGKTMTSYGEYTDPNTGKAIKTKSELTIRSLSMHSFVMYDMNDEGEWVKTLEIIYGKL